MRPLVSHYIQQVLAKDKTRRHSLASSDEETNFTASAAGAFACAPHHTKCLFVHKKNAGLTYTKKPGPLRSDTRVNTICKADATTVSSYAQTIRNTSQQVIKPHQRKNSERFQTVGSERTHKDSLAALGAHCDITLGSVRVWLARAQVSSNTSMPEGVTTQTRDAKSVRVKATLHRARRRSDGSKRPRAGWKGSHIVSASSTRRQCSSHRVFSPSGRSSIRSHHPPARTEFPSTFEVAEQR